MQICGCPTSVLPLLSLDEPCAALLSTPQISAGDPLGRNVGNILLYNVLRALPLFMELSHYLGGGVPEAKGGLSGLLSI
jgi:hypothetical protein